MKEVGLAALLLLTGGCAHGPCQLTLSKFRLGYFDDVEEYDPVCGSHYTHETTYGLILQWAPDDWLKSK